MCNPTPICSQDSIFNDLSCNCYPNPAFVRCAAPCDADMYSDPRSPCECIDEYELYTFFPSWADLDDIKRSLGLESSSKRTDDAEIIEPEDGTLMKPDYWPRCPDPWKMCSSEYQFNELACQCIYFNDCGQDFTCGSDWHDVFTQGCRCISEDEYWAYFPDWATRSDIEFSFRLAW